MAPPAEALYVRAGEHVVQFYESDTILLDTLERYVTAGLDASEACLIIATRSHRAQLDARLRASGRDMRAARRQGLYQALDADRLLPTLMVGDEPDAVRLTRAATQMLRRAASGGRRVRVFGEMVARLWLAHNQRAAIQFEALWNEVHQAATPPFTLLCAYPAAVLADEAARGALAAVCEQHTRVIPTAAEQQQSTTGQRLRSVARLQADTHVLQVEVEQRRRAEARYRALFEASRDGILTLDAPTGRIDEINPAAVALFDQPSERLIGRDLWQIGLFPTRASARAALGTMRAQPAPRWEALALRRPDGTERVVELSASTMRLDGAAIIQCTLRDVTERRHLEREAAARAADLEAIQAVMEVALEHAALPDLLHEMMGRLRTMLAVDNVAILLEDATGQALGLRYVTGPEEEVAGRVRVRIGHGVAGTIAATRQPLVIADLRTVPVENPFLRERLRSLMGVPLVVEDRLIGVIHASTIQPRAFTPGDVRLLQLVADRVARAIERAQLLEEVERARQEAVEWAGELNATIESIADGVVVFDREGRLAQMNATAQRLLGEPGLPDYTASSASPGLRHVRDGEGRPLAPDQWPVLRVLRGEEIPSARAVDLRIRGAEDQDVVVSVSGAPVRGADGADGAVRGAVCVFRDVTAQRALERRTHDALQALLVMAGALFDVPEPDEADADAPALADGVAGASPEARRLADLTRNVLACKRVGIVAIDPATRARVPVAVAGLTPAQGHQWWAEQAQPAETAGEAADPELSARLEAGEAVVVDMTRPPYASRPNTFGVTTTLVAPMRVGARLVGVLAIDFGDVPHAFSEQERALTGAVARLAAMVVERARLLREREEARASALAAEETATRMNTLLGIAGHELRTPVTSIKASVQLAERALEAYLREVLPHQDARPLQRAEALLQSADQQADRLTRLIVDVLDIARTQAEGLGLRAAVGDLAEVVRQVVEAQRLTWPGRALTLDLPSAPVTLSMDADRIEQVVVNLVTNALKYSPDDQPVGARVTVADDVARVAVSDHGPGLSPESQVRIWEPFYRVDPSQDKAGSAAGVGLGLHICRTLIERHHGRIDVASVAGQGATFWFELPLAAAAEGNA
jgi:PAS domain S-box-containing protein